MINHGKVNYVISPISDKPRTHPNCLGGLRRQRVGRLVDPQWWIEAVVEILVFEAQPFSLFFHQLNMKFA